MAVLNGPAAGGMVTLARLAIPCFPWTFAKGTKARRRDERKVKGEIDGLRTCLGSYRPRLLKRYPRKVRNDVTVCRDVSIYTLNESSNK